MRRPVREDQPIALRAFDGAVTPDGDTAPGHPLTARRSSSTELSSRGQGALAVARVSWGGLLIVMAPRLARWVGHPPDRRAAVVMRVLGFRHIVQAAVVARRPRYLGVGALLDLLHGISMLGLAAFDGPRRRAALLDATVAFGFAAGGRAVVQRSVGASADGGRAASGVPLGMGPR